MMSTKKNPPSERVKVKRLPQRGFYDPETIYPILDEALICHVGFDLEGHVAVIPTACWREGNRLFIHGSSASRMLRRLAEGVEACVEVTLLDGLVLARSGFHHSMNYRSVVVYGKAEPIEDPGDKNRVLTSFMEKIAPGRWQEVREPTRQELKATAVLAFDLSEASAKIRTGPPIDDEEDYALPVWAGVVPLRLTADKPEADARLPQGIPLPDYVTEQWPTK